MITILFIGDIIGENGLDLTLDLLPRIRHSYKVDFIMVNGENVKSGKGLTVKEANVLKSSGVDVITSGNHIWDYKNNAAINADLSFVLRPLNYPSSTPGRGFISTDLKNNIKVTVVNVQGRSFMYPINCPFEAMDFLLADLEKDKNIIVVDMHAESTAEKQALAWYLDGRVAAFLGTHTHVQTADERILPKGTGYITDVGMTGSFNSVIGMKTEAAIFRFKNQIPNFYETAEGDLRLNGIILKINEKDLKTVSIERLNFSKLEYNGSKTN